MKKSRITGVAVALSAFLSVSCHADNASQPPAGWPQGYEDFTITWTAEKGIDLLTGPAVPVRAYIESFFLAELTGDGKYVYPGFREAVTDEWRPGVGDPANAPWIGTVTNHLLSLTTTGVEVSAIGCMYTYKAASPNDDGRFEAHGAPVGEPEAGADAFKVTLQATQDSADHRVPQNGLARTPYDNVFAGYRITGYWGGFFRAETMDSQIWPEREQSAKKCLEKAADSQAERLLILESTFPRIEFPTLPAEPGWPSRK